MMMKKLLIICDNFPPQSGPRMGYLVKYAKRLGWSSWVVAAENKNRSDLTGLSGYAEEVHVVPQKPHRKWNLLHMLPFFWPYDYLRGEYDMRRIALDLTNRVKFDLVLCTHTFGHFPLSTAHYVAKKAHLPLVVDIRDLMAQNPKTSFFKLALNKKFDKLRTWMSWLSNWRIKRIHSKAAMITTISRWHANYLRRLNKNVRCIFNGFDPEVFHEITPVKNSCFEIVYTGTLATPDIRDYELLLEAMSELYRRHCITPDTFHVSFYCGKIMSTNPIKDRIEALGISKFFSFHDFVPLREVPDLFAKASVLLLLTAKSGKRGTHGIMTTKFFEYLASRRPILCVRSDEDCIEDAIRETNSGCAARTRSQTEGFLLEKLEEWKRAGVVRGTTDTSKLVLFSRETQAEQFLAAFQEVLVK